MVNDPIVEYLARTHDGAKLRDDLSLEADVVVVGSGAGGGITAEVLSQAGRKVIIVEEGPLKTTRDFKMLEKEAMPQLYQESGARLTKDKGIKILQGRAVGGSTTVNWTTSLRPPKSTLDFWQRELGLKGISEADIAPYFDQVERRLSIAPWSIAPNPNNQALFRGAQKLGFETHVIPRNVQGCWNLGYCGLGCPVGAKQSMLVTTLPEALKNGAELYYRLRAERFVFENDRIQSLICTALQEDGAHENKVSIKMRATQFVLASGAIGSPGLLLRSNAPDPHGIVGSRTFLHPVAASVAFMPEKVNGFEGAPQSVYSDQFNQLESHQIGFKLEVPPLQPVLAATTLTGIGDFYRKWVERLPFIHAQLALLRDGFHSASQGGKVYLKSDATPGLDYPISPFLWQGLQRALLTMAELQFAAGAKEVLPIHEEAQGYSSWSEAKVEIPRLALEILRMKIFSAHVMGGCPMGVDPKNSVVDAWGRHRQIENLSLHDGSIFPTSIGANPQLSIYAFALRNAQHLVVN